MSNFYCTSTGPENLYSSSKVTTDNGNYISNYTNTQDRSCNPKNTEIKISSEEKVNHPSISEDKEQQELYKKYFPNGGGSIFTFEIKGGAEEAQKFIDNLELFSLLANVADVKSLAIHPASTTHSECNEAELLDQGIKPNTIRLSIGTENIDDIIEDLDEAFKALV